MESDKVYFIILCFVKENRSETIAGLIMQYYLVDDVLVQVLEHDEKCEISVSILE